MRTALYIFEPDLEKWFPSVYFYLKLPPARLISNVTYSITSTSWFDSCFRLLILQARSLHVWCSSASCAPQFIFRVVLPRNMHFLFWKKDVLPHFMNVSFRKQYNAVVTISFTKVLWFDAPKFYTYKKEGLEKQRNRKKKQGIELTSPGVIKIRVSGEDRVFWGEIKTKGFRVLRNYNYHFTPNRFNGSGEQACWQIDRRMGGRKDRQNNGATILYHLDMQIYNNALEEWRRIQIHGRIIDFKERINTGFKYYVAFWSEQ